MNRAYCTSRHHAGFEGGVIRHELTLSCVHVPVGGVLTQGVTHAQGHKDWLFGAAWVTERHLVTCSRDRSVKLWQINEDGPAVCSTPLHTSLLHKVWGYCAAVMHTSLMHSMQSPAVRWIRVFPILIAHTLFGHWYKAIGQRCAVFHALAS